MWYLVFFGGVGLLYIFKCLNKLMNFLMLMNFFLLEVVFRKNLILCGFNFCLVVVVMSLSFFLVFC